MDELKIYLKKKKNLSELCYYKKRNAKCISEFLLPDVTMKIIIVVKYAY